jgi:hypothetical protein
MASKTSTVSKRQKTTTSQRYCLVLFPSEGTHGIWPECLIRKKGQFNFEAKFGKQWYECRIELEGITCFLVMFEYILFFFLQGQKKNAKKHKMC